MKVRQLDIIKLLYQEESLLKAAELSNLSVEAIEEILNDLETRFGEALFKKEGPNLSPTSKGVDFLKFLEALPDSQDRKQSDSSIPNAQHNSERYSAVYEKFGDPIIITDIDGTIIDCNPAALDVFGVTREKYIGKNNYIEGLATSQVDIERQSSLIEEEILKSGQYRYTTPILKDEDLHYIEVIVKPFEDTIFGGDARIWYGRDITTHVLAEEALQVGLMDADFTRQKVEDEGADLVAKADELSIARDEAEVARKELAEREELLQIQIFEADNARQTLEQQNSELAALADAIAIAKSEADEARDEVQKAYNTIEGDLRAAELLQRALLPDEFLSEQGIIFSSFYIPSTFLSGDIFNYFKVDDDLFCFYSVDVSGHGVPSALLSVSLSNLIRPSLIYRFKVDLEKREEFSLKSLTTDTVTFLNKRFQMNEETSQYFTISVGILDVKNKKMAICQAGHPSSFLLKKSGEIIINTLGGVPVGFLEDAGYEAQEYDLEAGDRIYIYTDGIIECDNPFEEQLGEAKFLEILLKHKSKPLEEVNSILQNYLKEWRAKPDYGDDISLIAIEIK